MRERERNYLFSLLISLETGEGLNPWYFSVIHELRKHLRAKRPIKTKMKQRDNNKRNEQVHIFPISTRWHFATLTSFFRRWPYRESIPRSLKLAFYFHFKYQFRGELVRETLPCVERVNARAGGSLTRAIDIFILEQRLSVLVSLPVKENARVFIL